MNEPQEEKDVKPIYKQAAIKMSQLLLAVNELLSRVIMLKCCLLELILIFVVKTTRRLVQSELVLLNIKNMGEI